MAFSRADPVAIKQSPFTDWALFCDFAGMFVSRPYFRIPGATVTANIADVVTVSGRSVSAFAANKDGSLSTFSSGQARLTDKGLFLDTARTNTVKQSCDATNATWTKTGLTAARVTGPDNVINSGSSLTLSATGTGTITQVMSLTSGTIREMDVYMRLRSGNPTVQISLDGTVFETKVLTATWQQFGTAPVTVGTSGTVTIKLTGNIGDAIDVFGIGVTIGMFATTPIVTTTGSVTRQLEDVYFTTAQSFLDAARMTALCWFTAPYATAVSGTAFAFSNPSGSSAVIGNYRLGDFHAGVTLVNSVGTLGVDPQDPLYTMATNGPLHCFGITYDRNNGRVLACLDGGPVNDNVYATTVFPDAGLTQLRVSKSTGGSPLNGWTHAIAAQAETVTAGDLRSLCSRRVLSPV